MGFVYALCAREKFNTQKLNFYEGLRLVIENHSEEIELESDSQFIIIHIKGVNYHCWIISIIADTLIVIGRITRVIWKFIQDL